MLTIVSTSVPAPNTTRIQAIDYTTLNDTELHYTTLQYTTLYYTTLNYTALYYTTHIERLYSLFSMVSCFL